MLRWLLAATVMVSHGWDLTQSQRGLDPSVALLSFPVSRLAVFLFFTLSGFLVAGSLVKRGVRDFAIARALRLLPGLWTMLVVLPVVLWAAFGTMRFAAFAADPATLRFIGRNALLIGGEYRLPGLFAGHPVPGVANGSLWTIPLEVRCYIMLALIGAAGLLLPRRRATLLIVSGMALHLALPIDLVPALTHSRWLGFAFFAGVLAWLWRERVFISWWLAALLAAAALAVPAAWVVKVAAMELAFGYAALTAAFLLPAPVKRFSAAMPDYSYGIYIWAFPAQQAAFALGAVTPMANIGVGAALMFPFAAASWHLIEAPSLLAKRRFSKQF